MSLGRQRKIGRQEGDNTTLLPISSSTKRKGHKRQVKLPINMQSKYQKKCPNCKGPMVQSCINCGFKTKPKEPKEQIAKHDLFSKASKIK